MRLIAEADTGRDTGTRATLSVLLDKWWEHKVGRLSPTTAREYKRLVDKRIRSDLGKRRIDSLTAADLDAPLPATADVAFATFRRNHLAT